MIKVGKKGNKKKQKKKEVISEEAFQLDFAVINKLSFLKISPPLALEDLDTKIKDLTERMNSYI